MFTFMALNHIKTEQEAWADWNKWKSEHEAEDWYVQMIERIIPVWYKNPGAGEELCYAAIKQGTL